MLVGLCFTADEWRDLDDAERSELMHAASGAVVIPAAVERSAPTRAPATAA